MKSNEQKPTNPEQLNCKTSPLFEPLNLEQQQSVVGGLFSQWIANAFSPNVFIPGRAEAVAAAEAAEAEAEARGFPIQFTFFYFLN